MRALLVAWRSELVIFGLSLVFQAFFYALLFSASDVRVGTVEYHQTAVNLARGQGFVLRVGDPPLLWRPPLYVWLLAGIFGLMGAAKDMLAYMANPPEPKV